MRPLAAHPWAGLYVLAFAVLGAITTEVVPIGLVPEIVTAFGVDEAGAGSLISLYAILVAVTAVPLTRLTARAPRKPLLLVTLAVFTLSNTLAALAPTFAWLMAARAIGGVAHALFFAISIGYASRIAPKGQTGRAMALVATGVSAGLILGVPAGTALAEAVGWRLAFAVLAVLVTLAGIAASVLLPPVSHDVSAGRTLVPGGGRMLLIAGLSGAAFLGYYTLYTYVSPLLLAAGLPPVWLSAVLVGIGATGLVGIRIAAPRLDHHPYGWMVAVPAAIAVAQLGVALAFPHLALVLVAAALWTAAFGPVNSTYQNTLVRAGREGPEMAGAWINVLSNAGIAGGSALGGVLVTGPGYAAAGLVGAGIVLGALLVTLVARRLLTF
ncbi:multidrug resistance protein [Microbacterium resistens]|uniref:Multidrug resistance protein n=1 Tax=Microbacterium resistens TaxID=156977 RepID=A0ABU1SAF4_9MICO|nr:MFS transporter [Microbacterium resistens]MDR6866591.1 multidrug resistance protein [Microbacterium resistens]